jgi:pimeloyl-ACP methyl ester carboxylesterase
MSEDRAVITVHLVHGTWANGWLKSKKPWFEPGAQIYEQLRKQIPNDVRIRTFDWSGRNSISSRDEAADLLYSELNNSIRQQPHMRHVIVAHSHGGTVAANALTRFDQDSPQLAQVKALICLATPFAYLVGVSKRQFMMALLATASVAHAVCWWLLLAVFQNIPGALGSVGFAALVALLHAIVFAIVVYIGKSHEDSVASPAALHPEVQVFLLRATRDEASLSIGLMQTFSWLGSAFANNHEMALSSRLGLMTYVKHFVVYYPCLLFGWDLAGRFASRLGISSESLYSLAALAIVFGAAVAGAVYLLSYALLAGVVGHTRVSSWLRTQVEVDAAPPGVMCSMKVYSTLSGSFSSLRHRIYEDEEVIKDVGIIVCNVAKA